jgi:hypothetical protein
MDHWMAAVAKDPRHLSLAKKIIADKPKTLVDRCTDGGGNDTDESVCDASVQAYSDPQLEGGMPMTDDTLRCALKPLRKQDYEGVSFTSAQWAQMTEIFPHGVCDFTKPGIGRHPTSTWQTYQTSEGKVIYGGRSLGREPKSVAVRASAKRR